jgi:hypothetical protein
MRIVLGVVLLTLVHASDAAADWTLAAYLGASQTRATSLTLSQPGLGTSLTLSPVHYDGASFDQRFYYGCRVAFFPRSRWLGVEGELIHFKVIADTSRTTTAAGTLGGARVDGPRPLGSLVERFDITHGVNLLLVNAVVRREAKTAPGDARPRVALVGRFGLGASFPHPESIINGARFDAYEWGAFSMQAAGGIELRVRGPVYVLGEYKISRTVQDVTIAGGSARTPLVTQHLVAGLVIRFGKPRVLKADIRYK